MPSRAAIPLVCAALGLAGPALAQSSTPSLVGTWTAAFPDPATGALVFGSEVYTPDGRFVATLSLPAAGLVRIAGHYRLEATGAGQVRDVETAESVLPRQVCFGSLARCQPGPPLAGPQTVTLTFLDADTIRSVGQSGTVLSRRDPGAMLAQAAVPDTLMRPAPVGPAGGGEPAPALGVMNCSIGETECFSGWLRTCEQGPAGGTRWMTGAQRCDE